MASVIFFSYKFNSFLLDNINESKAILGGFNRKNSDSKIKMGTRI